jgi:phage baseplate assembly protein W
MAVANPKFLGRGWAFPPAFDVPVGPDGVAAAPGRTGMVAGDADIQESLRILFATLRGERLLQPDYGVGIEADVDTPLGATQLGALRSKIEHAIRFFEPRIKVRAVTLRTDRSAEGVLEIGIDYDIPAVNARSNMVYPFYVREGTSIRGR